MNNLPLNWCECKLVDICNVYQPKTISTKELVEGGKYNVYGANGIIGKYNQYNHENSEILITCRGATCGTINKSEPFSWINGNAMVVHPFIEGLSTDFLFYYLHSINFKPYISGSAQPQITRISLSPLGLKLPPLAEQGRIVEKIETLFQDIDVGVEKLKAAQAQIKQYRQSVLSAAFSGKLYKTAERKEVQLKDVCKKINDGTHFTPTYVEQGIPFISVKDIRDKKIYFDSCRHITNEEHKSLYERCNPEYEDVLITKSGTIGRTCIVNTTEEFGLFVSVALLKPNKDKIMSSYLMYALDNYIAHIDVQQDVKGGVIKNLHIEDIKKIEIILPSISEQQHIVAEIENRFAVADELEKSITDALTKAEKLKQSILKKAFEGKLVPQDPNDEPASILLERIKKEKQSSAKGKKR